MTYEIRIAISDESYVDDLIISLVRQGYSVYYNPDDKMVCYTTEEDGVYKVKETG